MDLESIGAFLKVVETGGFTAAARELGVAQSTISRRVSELERRLEQTLLERTTRRLLLTEAGKRYADAVRHLLAGLAQAEAEIAGSDAPIAGPLRISISTGYGRSTLLPVLATIARANPRIQLDIDLSDRYVDVLAEDYDLAIRMTEPDTSGLEAIRLHQPVHSLLCASPAYMREHPLSKVSDIAADHCIVQRTYSARTIWSLEVGGAIMRLSVKPRMIVNDIQAIHQLVLGGVGMAILPLFLVRQDLREERLILPFPEVAIASRPVFMVWPSHKKSLSRLLFVRKAITEALQYQAET